MARTRKRKPRFISIKAGSVTVKIYPTPDRVGKKIYPAWTIAYYEGRRKLIKLSDLKVARLKAGQIANRLATGEAQALKLTGSDQLAYVRAVNALKNLNIPVDMAVLELVEAKKHVKDGSLIEAAKDYARRSLKPIPKRSVLQVVEELLKNKRKLGMSDVYVADLSYRCRRFAAACQMPIQAVTAERIRTEFLDKLTRAKKGEEKNERRSLSARSHNNFVRALGTLFEFAKAREYLPKDFAEMDRLEFAKERSEKIETFTVDEMDRLMTAASQPAPDQGPGSVVGFADLLPFVAIGGFAGIRTAEILRLDWSAVHLAERFIEVTAGKAKTASRRLAPVTDNLAGWLNPYSKCTGPVWKHGRPYLFEARTALAVAAKVKWKQNALRHSFISYRLAQIKNVNQVALEAGNSAAIIFKDYLELVRPADAIRWFAIAPATQAGVIQFTAQP